MLLKGSRPTASPCRRTHRAGLLLVMAVVVPAPVHGEDGHEACLRYAPIQDEASRKRLAALSAVVVRLDESPPRERIEKALLLAR